MLPLILASSSPYRQQLLRQLGLPFTSESPAIDESPLPGEPPAVLVSRLARAKAEAVAGRYTQALVIGSDQVAELGGEVLTKPLDHRTAVSQLRACRGRRVTFHTGLCLLNSGSGGEQITCVPFEVEFRQLTDLQIEHYLRREQPYDCAGSFKVEGLGISLFTRLMGEDYSSLVGLPLIALCDMLMAEGVDPVVV
ncbi:septum formation inhibitor Maf [Exilibacterium tricleocarpae]|uniref:7-methyl-GTP pyrophosphatase n=1 Tax=Exilibacterium tricleocarpae TaxID=2591008 RepID=A0A545T8D0_9GAMM|nr:Maf family protein [Exilibacterium tricleocarpae]TQV73482.1 septum formation inhibitor Maf [Exilibacterium tricleocarpae]